jgi:4-hydroxy-tetrahydrodipicolinate synthase
MPELLRGVFPILATPFDAAGRVEVEALQRELDFLVAAGVNGVGIALASEVPTFNEAERDLVLRTVVEQARGRVPVVMNTGAAATDLAVFYTLRAEDLGATAVMVLPPSPAIATADETVAYYGQIARSTRLPVFMQDIPTSPVSAGLAARVAASTEHPWYAKVETPPTPARVAEAVAIGHERFGVFGGAGGAFFVEELRRGAIGTMPGAAIPEAFVEVWRLFQLGQVDQAQAVFARYATLLNLLSQGMGIWTYLYKEVLRLRGVFSNTSVQVRKPATEPDELAYREVRRQVELLGLGSGVVV